MRTAARAALAALVALVLLGSSFAMGVDARAYDMCPNLKGMQKTVPDGYVRLIGFSGWECIPAP